mgnify:FL=1
MLLGLVTAAVALVIDQASKYWILHDVLEDKVMIIFTPFFSLVRAWNTGVSFSMFNDWGLSGVIVLSLVAFVIIAFLVNWLRKEPSKLIQVSLGLIIGGALGNVIDRIRLGAVFDFLDFSIGTYHWPAFNAADSFICVGALIVIFHGLWNTKKTA